LSSENTAERPDITAYTDYRAYLRAMAAFLRVVRPGFSFRSFAKRAGFASPNYLKLVTDGMRNLAPDSVDKFARGLGLSRREHEVFRILVAMANARTDDERNSLFARLRERVVHDETARLRDDQFAVYDMWWALVVREMANLPEFEHDARWVARRLRPRVRSTQAQRALELLERLGMLTRGADGRTRATDRTVSTGPELQPVQSLAVRNYHRAHLDLAARSLDEVPREARNITSVTLVLSEAGYAEAVEEIAKLRRRLLEISDNPVRGRGGAVTQGEPDQASAREVYSVVLSLYPVTQPARDLRAFEVDEDEPPSEDAGDVGGRGEEGS
jgi:uncharacterized protein (TIGR02147 family)